MVTVLSYTIYQTDPCFNFEYNNVDFFTNFQWNKYKDQDIKCFKHKIEISNIVSFSLHLYIEDDDKHCPYFDALTE